MPTTSTGSASSSTGREPFDAIEVPENNQWLGPVSYVHGDKKALRVEPLVHERQVITSTTSTFSRVSSSYAQIRIPRGSGDLMGNNYLTFTRQSWNVSTVTYGAVYALDFEAYQSIASIRYSYRGVRFWEITGQQMYSMLMELPEKERAAIAVTAAGHRSRAERKVLAATAQTFTMPILTPWHNQFDNMFPLKNLVDDILVEVAFIEKEYVLHTPGTAAATHATVNGYTSGQITALYLNMDIYHERAVNSVDSLKRFSKGGSGKKEWVFDEWQMHVAEPISQSSASQTFSLKLDNLTGQIYKIGVQVRAQANVMSTQYLSPNYTEPLNIVKLQSNNKDIVVAEYHYREAYGTVPDTMEHYYEHLANPGSELSESSVDRQFVYLYLGPPHYNPLNKPTGAAGAAGTRSLPAYTAPTIIVTLYRASASVNIHCPAFADEGGSNSASSGLAYQTKYLTVVGYAKNKIEFSPGVGPVRLYNMR